MEEDIYEEQLYEQPGALNVQLSVTRSHLVIFPFFSIPHLSIPYTPFSSLGFLSFPGDKLSVRFALKIRDFIE